jgi:hypothetical protein
LCRLDDDGREGERHAGHATKHRRCAYYGHDANIGGIDEADSLACDAKKAADERTHGHARDKVARRQPRAKEEGGCAKVEDKGHRHSPCGSAHRGQACEEMHEEPLDAAMKDRRELIVLVRVGAVEAMEGDVKFVFFMHGVVGT